MRIFVHEFATGGGFAGRAIPASLAREGLAIRTALIADLTATRRHDIVTTTDLRFPMASSRRRVEAVAAPPEQRQQSALLDRLIASADAVWLIAPETDRCLERLAARAERKGRMLVGSGSAAIRRASDKAALATSLPRHGVPYPATRMIASGDDWRGAARELGYPLVVKPSRGAGCEGVCLARNEPELARVLRVARANNRDRVVLLQSYVRGTAASVSLLVDGQRAVSIGVNGQSVRASRRFSYHGGTTPLDHRLASHAADIAMRTCRALPGLRGYIGVDVVLTRSEAVVIEVNPRLTTAYLGLRSVLNENVATMALAACAGRLPKPPSARRRIRFTSAGRIVESFMPNVWGPPSGGPIRLKPDPTSYETG